MKCEKCLQDFNSEWKTGLTYEGIDVHHSPPTFMLNKWEGILINLCRNCHQNIHIEISHIIFKHSTLLKPNKSEYWLWKHIIPINHGKVIEEVENYTQEWLNNMDQKK